MPEYTTQFNLPKALANENVSLSAHNSLVEAIDTNIGNALTEHMADYATFLSGYNSRNADLQFLNLRGCRYLD
ncbi:MAG: hypothetical protein FNP40_02520 [Dehalobacter sp. 4CP]|uniref:hypothetical protein n=1 Tax=Dehalobacter sp. CP TaxID=2594474 RepID=UPI0013C5E37D|nr:hypothetical protein [Dehalobacter sp.]NBJ14448.1 hypothetical protein [Dehalobacter sp. 4CP]